MCRFFLGLTEAGLFPGVQFYLSCWYKRGEFGIRSAIFFSAAALAGSFGGLLAAAIAKMNGVAGIPGWAWIFILEGLLTVVIGIASFWMVHDFPDEARFLSPDEKNRVLRRLASDKQGSSKHEDFQVSFLTQVLKDWKTYTGMIIYMGKSENFFWFSELSRLTKRQAVTVYCMPSRSSCPLGRWFCVFLNGKANCGSKSSLFKE